MESERRVERERVLDAEPAEVWEALTDEALLREWLGDDVGPVERVDEERALTFTWVREGEGLSSVELTLEPAVSGTRLRVVEEAIGRPLAAAAGPLWEMRLGGLARLLQLALV